jgi:hypothetical protein
MPTPTAAPRSTERHLLWPPSARPSPPRAPPHAGHLCDPSNSGPDHPSDPSSLLLPARCAPWRIAWLVSPRPPQLLQSDSFCPTSRLAPFPSGPGLPARRNRPALSSVATTSLPCFRPRAKRSGGAKFVAGPSWPGRPVSRVGLAQFQQ